MMQMLAVLAVISLAVMVAMPAYAEVTSLSLSEDSFSVDEAFTFSGINDGGGRVDVLILPPDGGRAVLAAAFGADANGVFVTMEQQVRDVFKSSGIYTVTAFTPEQKKENGVTIQIQYDGSRIFEVPDFELRLSSIRDQTIEEGERLAFTATATDRNLRDLEYSLLRNAPAGATIDSDSGRFEWTPSASQGTRQGAVYEFDIVVVKGALEDRQSIKITVKEPAPSEPVLQIPAPFVDRAKEPQSYVDRYNDEAAYKKWFDETYPEYSSIYQAVGLDEPRKTPRADDAPVIPAPFVDSAKDPQSYVDRYNNESAYKEWFDKTYPEYSSIHQAVGLDDPQAEPKPQAGQKETRTVPDESLVIPAPFVDQARDPQSYVDRYNDEPSYKEWFEKTYPEYSSIYQAVGLEAPKELAPFVDPAQDPQYYIDRYNNEPTYTEWFDKTYPDITIYDAVGVDPPKELAPFVDPAQDPQYYIDRYNNEPTYTEWFDKTYPDITIYDAVGVDPPKELAPFVDPAQDPQYYIDRYNNEPTYTEWFDKTYPDITIYDAVGVDESGTVEPTPQACGTGTILVDGKCVAVPDDGGGCLIATAAYGSEMAPQVQILREIRDGQLMNTASGESFMAGFNEAYYSFSPYVADYQRENPVFRDAVRVGIAPMISTLSIMEHADTETEVLGYGIGVILLNVGIYVAAPVMLFLAVRRVRKAGFRQYTPARTVK